MQREKRAWLNPKINIGHVNPVTELIVETRHCSGAMTLEMPRLDSTL
jgi:hypothetical protein